MNQEYEYIATLSPEEKKIFVESFCCMVCSDKKVAKEEIDFLKNIGKMYEIPEKDNLTIELDVFEGKFDGLLLAEVEFASEEEALGYIPPEWFGEDVSNSTKYHNSTLSRLP